MRMRKLSFHKTQSVFLTSRMKGLLADTGMILKTLLETKLIWIMILCSDKERMPMSSKHRKEHGNRRARHQLGAGDFDDPQRRPRHRLKMVMVSCAQNGRLQKATVF